VPVTATDGQQFWFPAFSTRRMQRPRDYSLETYLGAGCMASHVVKRRFILMNQAYRMFPMGYFSSLLVHVANRYPENPVTIWGDGMVLEVAPEPAPGTTTTAGVPVHHCSL
jgi:hypothetical protein